MNRFRIQRGRQDEQDLDLVFLKVQMKNHPVNPV